MLMRDEQTSAAYEPPAVEPPQRPPPSILMVLEVVARHFDVPVGSLTGHRCQGGARPLALIAAIAVAKTVTGATLTQVKRLWMPAPAQRGPPCPRSGTFASSTRTWRAGWPRSSSKEVPALINGQRFRRGDQFGHLFVAE